MENVTAGNEARSRLLQSIVEAAKNAFDPTKDSSSRAGSLSEFKQLMDGYAI
jgi:hypothetical protein